MESGAGDSGTVVSFLSVIPGSSQCGAPSGRQCEDRLSRLDWAPEITWSSSSKRRCLRGRAAERTREAGSVSCEAACIGMNTANTAWRLRFFRTLYGTSRETRQIKPMHLALLAPPTPLQWQYKNGLFFFFFKCVSVRTKWVERMTADKRHQHDCKAEVIADLGTQRKLKTKHEEGGSHREANQFSPQKKISEFGGTRKPMAGVRDGKRTGSS